MSTDLIVPQQSCMPYVDGFKYQLTETISFLIPTLAEYSGTECGEFIRIEAGGTLVLNSGFASDGASGPTVDTPSSMRGAFVHDALYELMRKGFLPRDYRSTADRIIREMCIKDKMWAWRANAWKKFLTWFGGKNVLASRRRETKYAP